MWLAVFNWNGITWSLGGDGFEGCGLSPFPYRPPGPPPPLFLSVSVSVSLSLSLSLSLPLLSLSCALEYVDHQDMLRGGHAVDELGWSGLGEVRAHISRAAQVQSGSFGVKSPGARAKPRPERPAGRFDP
jgi:hypothetical protein